MNKITRRMKEDAVGVFHSRKIDANIAFRLVGWLESQAIREIRGEGSVTAGKCLTDFYNEFATEIRVLPLREDPDSKQLLLAQTRPRRRHSAPPGKVQVDPFWTQEAGACR